MERNERLEKIVDKIIKRFDNTKIIGEPGVDQVVHSGEPLYNDPRARKRHSHEISLAKLTRKLFFEDNKSKRFRKSMELSSAEKEGLIYFTRRRKELGAVWVDFLKQGLANFYFGDADTYTSGPLFTETEFLDFYTQKVLHGGSRLFKDHEIEVGDLKTHTTYSALTLVKEWITLKNQGNCRYEHLKTIRKEGNSIPYLMHALYKSTIKSNDNSPSLIFGRVKHSDSANIKQAQMWAEELDLCDRLKLYADGNAKVTGYKDSEELALKLKSQEPKSSAFVRRFKSAPGNAGKEPSRLDELLSNWRYDIEDLFGITIVLPRDYDPEFTYSLVNYFKAGNSIFVFEEGSEDDHTKKSDKPSEFQFKVRVNKELLYSQLSPEIASEIYMPDTIEIQIISAPDLVHKQLAPYLSERYYKGRKTRERLATPEARKYYDSISGTLKSISPVNETIADEEKHIGFIRNNLNSPNTYPEEYGSFKRILYFRNKLFKKFVFF